MRHADPVCSSGHASRLFMPLQVICCCEPANENSKYRLNGGF